MNYDQDKVDEIVLALMYLTITGQDDWGARSWKSYSWDAMGRLHAKGYISDPRTQAKSVILSPKGLKKATQLFQQHFANTGN